MLRDCGSSCAWLFILFISLEKVLTVTITNNTKLFPGHSLGEYSNDYAFAVIKADGSVVTWGDSNYGGYSGAVAAQLDGTIDVTQIYSTIGPLPPCAAMVRWLPGGTVTYGGYSAAVAAQLNGTIDVKQIYSTKSAFAALRSDGSVVTWGGLVAATAAPLPLSSMARSMSSKSTRQILPLPHCATMVRWLHGDGVVWRRQQCRCHSAQRHDRCQTNLFDKLCLCRLAQRWFCGYLGG